MLDLARFDFRGVWGFTLPVTNITHVSLVCYILSTYSLSLFHPLTALTLTEIYTLSQLSQLYNVHTGSGNAHISQLRSNQAPIRRGMRRHRRDYVIEEQAMARRRRRA